MLLSNLCRIPSIVTTIISASLPMLASSESSSGQTCMSATCQTAQVHPPSDPNAEATLRPALSLLLQAFLNGADVAEIKLAGDAQAMAQAHQSLGTRLRTGNCHFLASVFAAITVVSNFHQHHFPVLTSGADPTGSSMVSHPAKAVRLNGGAKGISALQAAVIH